jgi:hypothetical protein
LRDTGKSEQEISRALSLPWKEGTQNALFIYHTHTEHKLYEEFKKTYLSQKRDKEMEITFVV